MNISCIIIYLKPEGEIAYKGTLKLVSNIENLVKAISVAISDGKIYMVNGGHLFSHRRQVNLKMPF